MSKRVRGISKHPRALRKANDKQAKTPNVGFLDRPYNELTEVEKKTLESRGIGEEEYNSGLRW